MTSASAGDAEFVLRFASINNPGTPSYDQILMPFARAVEEKSGGRIEVTLKPLGGYGKPAGFSAWSKRARSRSHPRCRDTIPAASRSRR